jgi:hypothetical protein
LGFFSIILPERLEIEWRVKTRSRRVVGSVITRVIAGTTETPAQCKQQVRVRDTCMDQNHKRPS